MTWQLQAMLDKPVLPGDFWKEDQNLRKTQCTHLSYQGLGKRFALSGSALREGGSKAGVLKEKKKAQRAMKCPGAQCLL